MTEIISVKKDIIFKTKISEITSLNLEHDYKIEDDFVDGKLILSGTYKMTEASLLEEEFLYNIPFSIAIGDNIKKDTIKIDIDDFKYDIHKDVMKVNVELELACDEIEEGIFEDESITEKLKEYNSEDVFKEENNEEEDDAMEGNVINESGLDVTLEDVEVDMSDNSINNTEFDNNGKINDTIIDKSQETAESINKISNSFNANDNYHTYKIYIVREGDTVESICTKYNLHIDDIKEYNNLENIEIGDKIVIPSIIIDD